MDLYVIKITEYCSKYDIDTEFLYRLEEENLIKIQVIDNDQWIDESQFTKIEQYIRWYYDLSVNIEGISVMDHLLEKIEGMQAEIKQLRQQVGLLDSDLFH